EWQWITKPLREDLPIPNAITAFTDAGKRTRRAAITWNSEGQWHHHLISADPEDNLQTLELLAVIWALQNFQEPVNVVSDSLYVVGVVSRIEEASIKEVSNPRLGQLFL
ncbi:POK6 protein, partial [Callaeas wilsoni]|nr:POK6 protein [Callaeas wilsoni]